MKASERHILTVLTSSLAALALIVCSPVFASAHLLLSLDASLGYLFVSEADGTPWFSNTEFPSVALGVGGDTWAMGLSADYAQNVDSYDGSVPGYSDSLDSVEKKLSNASFRFFARIFPGGRGKLVSPYLTLGVGPALTYAEYEGKNTGRRVSDSAVRVNYSVSVGSKLRLWNSRFSAFLEGSFGGLGELGASDEGKSATVPKKGFDFVGVAAGLGVTFH